MTKTFCWRIPIFPPYNVEVLHYVFGKMAQWPNLPILVMGDFNNIMNEEEDRYSTKKGKQKMKRTRFAGQLQEMGLIDLWRIRYPLRREYSCCSSTYGSLSRIDLALGNDNFLPWAEAIQYGPRGLSDHSPLIMSIQFEGQTLSLPWKISPQWLLLMTEEHKIDLQLIELKKIGIFISCLGYYEGIYVGNND